VPLLALAAALLPAARAWAGVEYVTPTSNCQQKIVNAGQTLHVVAGQNVQFEVWGNSIDLSNRTSGFKLSAPSGFSAHIVTQRSGLSNLGRGCGNVGSAVVSLDAPTSLSSDANASVAFTMPLGDKSTLALVIKAHPTFTATWTTNGTLQPSSLPCIVKTGSVTPLNQDTKLVVQLPPGHRQDQTTCTSNVITLTTHPASIGLEEVAGPTQKLTVTGLPSFMTESQATAVNPLVGANLTFTINVAGIRNITTQSTSTITITDPSATNRTATLTLVVKPDLGQGFANTASPNPGSVVVGDPIDFTITLSAPAAANQVITWRMTTASCFVQAITQAPYRATAPFQFFVFPQGQTSAIIRVRSQDGGGCSSKLNPITHIFEAWIGDSRTDPQVTTVTTAPNYTKTNVSLRFQ